jgi:hypothetical protein
MLCRGSMHKSVYNMLQEARRRDKMDRMRLWEDRRENIEEIRNYNTSLAEVEGVEGADRGEEEVEEKTS